MKKKFIILLSALFTLFVLCNSSYAFTEEILIEIDLFKLVVREKEKSDKKYSDADYRLLLKMKENEQEQYVLSENFFKNLQKNDVIFIENKGLIFPIYIDSSGFSLNFFDINTKQISNIDPYSLIELGIDGRFWFTEFQLSPSKKYLSVMVESEGIHEVCIYSTAPLPEVEVFCALNTIDKIGVTDEIKGYTWNLNWNVDDTFNFYYSQSYKWQDAENIHEAMKEEPKEVWEFNIQEDTIQKVAEIKNGEEKKDFFKDLFLSNRLYDSVYQAKSDGWLSGYPDGTIRLEDPVNRAEFAKLVIKAFKQKEVSIPEGTEYIFPDAPAKEWYAPTLYTATQLGLMQGYPDGTAKPEKTIIKVEALKIVLEMLGEEYTQTSSQYLDTESNQWYSKYTDFAKRCGLIQSDKDKIYPAKDITRGEAIELISKVLEVRKEK